MTKPKPKKASRRFTASPHKLKPETRGKLKRLLSNQDDKAIDKVESALAIGTVGAVHLDEIPRPADYVGIFRPIEKDAMDLFNRVCNLGDYYYGKFMEMGVDINAIKESLLKLITTANGVVEKYKGESSKGARKNNALCEVVRRLRLIFHDHYRGEVSRRTKRGAFDISSIEEDKELEFIDLALRDARLITSNFTQLRNLISDVRCAIPHERAETIERIARKTDKLRLSAETPKPVSSKANKFRTTKKGQANAR